MKEEHFSIDEFLSLDHQEAIKWYAEHINPTVAKLLKLVGFDASYDRAQGAHIYDRKGNRYIDLLSGYGALNLGHNHPRVVEALKKVLGKPVYLQASINPFAAALAKRLADLAPGKLSISFFSNSGTEAIEAALKMVRAATGKKVFLHAENSFHGKTFGSLSVTGRDKYRTLFEPLLPITRQVKFGDIHSLREELRKGDVAAFIVEPIQGEGGVVIPPDGYLMEASSLCHKYGALLVVDEIQTGLGRTGYMFAVEHDGAQPDIICLAKSLSGGLIPIGCTIATREVWEKAYSGMERCLLHTSTFGGNTLACAVAIETLAVIEEENLSEKARELGEYFLRSLSEATAKSPLVKEIRGRGLMIGLEFHPYEGVLSGLTRGKITEMSKEYTAHLVASELHEKFKIITAYTLNNPNVIRLQAPLVIEKSDIDYVIEAFSEVLSIKGFLGLVAKRAPKMLTKLFGSS